MVSIGVTIKQMQTCQTRKAMTEEGYATHSLWRWTGNECSLSDNKFKTKKGRYFTQWTARCWESFPQDPKLLSLHYVQKAMGQQNCLAAQWQTPVFAKLNSFLQNFPPHLTAFPSPRKVCCTPGCWMKGYPVLRWFRPKLSALIQTVGFQLLQNYFRSSTNSSITASSCTKAAMASHTFLVNGQQKTPHNPATENMLFCTVLFSAAVSGSDYAFPARVKMLKSFAAQFSIPSECIWR